MTLKNLVEQEEINFLLTNRIPRYALTVFMGWFSKIEQPWVRDASIGLWRLFADLDLSDAKKQEFKSLHDCFVRELKDGARPIDMSPEILVSPCDAIVGACGRIEGSEVLQIKGSPYDIGELLQDDELVAAHRDGCYVTLRLMSSMYHRFHAPHNCHVDRVTYVSGDVWNVNPIALRRIEKLFCKNERAVIRSRLAATGHPITLAPVAAVLVASMRFEFLDITLGVTHKGPKIFPCDARLGKGDLMGWFEHGSTIIVFAPKGFSLSPGVECGARIRVGEPLMRLPL
ncbi:archaetidylserine decarboxylase [Methylocystis bryophila]|uniref:phosphatidylserine decarboxylase n=1 Tax=Methylocystis bryophila TaxID=655015 RepID=A0A1W6MXS6_9HYPH|nr:archaetidylserine decarboxylase [Methylocystis bryophila]ARN82371.1 phosphatidylserine decarboxylase [Methylocystis bryophila]BDV38536.1 phosphatidylserine decarboxylase [Methylocystis bryophila]